MCNKYEHLGKAYEQGKEAVIFLRNMAEDVHLDYAVKVIKFTSQFITFSWSSINTPLYNLHHHL